MTQGAVGRIDQMQKDHVYKEAPKNLNFAIQRNNSECIEKLCSETDAKPVAQHL